MSLDLIEILPSNLWPDIINNIVINELQYFNDSNFLLFQTVLDDYRINNILTKEKFEEIQTKQVSDFLQNFGEKYGATNIESSIEDKTSYFKIL